MNENGKYFGKYRGVVLNNVDPMQMGRLMVEVPDVTGLAPSSWAMPCMPIAGIQNGMMAPPIIGSGVWIEFEQGDPDHTWLSQGFIHLGKCAALLKAGGGRRIECLLAATDDGVLGIMDHKGQLTKVFDFEGTAGVVLPSDKLLYDGVLYRVRGSQVHTVKQRK